MRNRLPLVLLLVASTFSAVAQPSGSPARTCASLAQLNLPKVTITQAENVAAGAFVPPDLKQGEKVPEWSTSLPAFCRVVAKLTPTADSDIKLEVWMPLSGWNGRFKGQGNGGFAGYIAYGGLAASITQGYATASTDTGHSSEGAAWALGHPEKVVDYGYRGIHEMTVDAKTIVEAFYQAGPKWSYFASCSNGGRQALMEAQRFPDDYDGILAGAPANAWTKLLTLALHILQSFDPSGYIPASKVPVIGKAVLAGCDAQDGVTDGVLNDPTQCHFHPETLLCRGADSDACLTASQVKSLRAIYGGLQDASGQQIFPGLLPGSEEGRGGWETWVTGSEPGKSAGHFYVTEYFANMVYEKPDWDYKTANIDDALKMADLKTAKSMNAESPDLKAFTGHGGKLIIYHGWNDPAIPALNSVHYYESVVSALGKQNADQSVRLYMVPGMQHCGGGPGATSFGQDQGASREDAQHDIFAALVQWVEKTTAPSTIIATKYKQSDPVNDLPKQVEMTRPLCPYPQMAEYSGSGEKNLAPSFVCTASKR